MAVSFVRKVSSTLCTVEEAKMLTSHLLKV